MFALVIEMLSTEPLAPAAEIAFNRVVEETRGPLLLYLARLLSDADEAMDVLQETYARALRQRGFLDEGFARRAWLYRVAGNEARSTLRRLKRWFRPHPEPSEVPTVLDRVLTTEAQAQVQQALAKLGYQHRQILLLRFYQELSYEEIAEVLSVPVGTVMSRLNRAKALFERSLS